MAESTEQTTCIKFKKRFSRLIYRFFFRVQLIYSDDLLAINSDHQSVAPSQDPLQTKGPLAQLQGQSSRCPALLSALPEFINIVILPSRSLLG